MALERAGAGCTEPGATLSDAPPHSSFSIGLPQTALLSLERDLGLEAREELSRVRVEAPKDWQAMHDPKVGLLTISVNRRRAARARRMRPRLFPASTHG